MKAFTVPILMACLAACPAQAQTPESDADRGFSLLEQGAQLLFRGIIDQMRPELEDMQKGLGDAAEKFGPKLRQFMALIDDVKNYEAPERLDNGDILLRRRADAPPPPPLLTEPPEAPIPDTPKPKMPRPGRPNLPPGHPPIPNDGIEL
ncbi:AAA+ family ATPase [uncultured Thioclava sp.]|uniref:AAA+ family ATPase n=1 Tax=uncultured Thioclava sp. TaxID=473858 RepID=UPI0025E7103D|nr:AAA+ family ATPase [uncultured Thioclava sp.]